MESIAEKIKQRRRLLDKKEAENSMLSEQIASNHKRMLECIDSLDVGRDAFTFLEDIANSRRSAIKDKIESILSEALALIYGDEYSVEFSYSVKNNRSFVDIELVKKTDDGEVRRTMNGFGGGVSDSISVPLRLLVLIASKETDLVCFLDECYKHLDGTRVENAAEFIRDISDKLGLQTVMMTHHEVMKEEADVVYEIVDDHGTAKTSRIK